MRRGLIGLLVFCGLLAVAWACIAPPFTEKPASRGVTRGGGGNECYTYTSGDTPLAIPNGTLESVSSVISGTEAGGIITSIVVTLTFTHDDWSEVEGTLLWGATSSEGMFSGDLSGNGELELAFSTDVSANNVEDDTPPYGSNPYSFYSYGGGDLADSNGVWTIELWDGISGADTGTFDSWSVTFCLATPTPTPTAIPTIRPASYICNNYISDDVPQTYINTNDSDDGWAYSVITVAETGSFLASGNPVSVTLSLHCASSDTTDLVLNHGWSGSNGVMYLPSVTAASVISAIFSTEGETVISEGSEPFTGVWFTSPGWSGVETDIPECLPLAGTYTLELDNVPNVGAITPTPVPAGIRCTLDAWELEICYVTNEICTDTGALPTITPAPTLTIVPTPTICWACTPTPIPTIRKATRTPFVYRTPAPATPVPATATSAATVPATPIPTPQKVTRTPRP